MLFNNKNIILKRLTENRFRAVIAGWIYDGKELHDLGDPNAITTVCSKRKMITSDTSGQEMMLTGGFPHYKLKVGNVIDLNIRKGDYLEDRDVHGVFIPPFGMGWGMFSQTQKVPC